MKKNKIWIIKEKCFEHTDELGFDWYNQLKGHRCVDMCMLREDWDYCPFCGTKIIWIGNEK